MIRHQGWAPGKVILFGEHAVVYKQPAIAVPVTQVQATAIVEAQPGGGSIVAEDTGQRFEISHENSTEPLVAIVQLTLAQLHIRSAELAITVRSSIPIASGLGSGAAVSVAIVRAMAHFYARPIDDATVSALAYEVEKLHHGTPSGIDNTVIAYNRPVYFVRGQPIQTFDVAHPFSLAIGNTGLASPTKIAVGDVRRGWEADRARYETWFAQIGHVVESARAAITQGHYDQLGELMRRNQALLRAIDVSGPELERLIEAAQAAGAAGAKLVGGGRGGNMIALVDETNRDAVVRALQAAGAVSVLVTTVGA